MKNDLKKLKNYLILASMIGGITLLPGCAGQKPDEQNNNQTANTENTLNLETNNYSDENNESTVLLVLDNGNYILYDCDTFENRNTQYIIDINGEKFTMPKTNVVRPFCTDEYGNAHDKANQYAYEMLHIDKDGFGSNRLIDYDAQIQQKYKKRNNDYN